MTAFVRHAIREVIEYVRNGDPDIDGEALLADLRAAKERAAPACRDRRAPAVEFVRTAGHLRGRGALDAGAAAPAGAGPSSSRRPVW